MKRTIIAVALGSLFALPAFANDEMDYPRQEPSTVPAKTVTQVRDELSSAKRMGDFIVNGETGEKAYQANPSAYPNRIRHAGKSRTEVVAELEQARRSGDFVVNAETGERANQADPSTYPARTQIASK